jgi:hypothetical protein
MGVAQDQDAPCVTDESQGARNRAGVIASIFVVHIILVVTNHQIGSIVRFKLIVTLCGRQSTSH